MATKTAGNGPPTSSHKNQEQINALRYAFLLEQIPLLYAVMLVAALIAALVFKDSAPISLVTAVPIGLAAVTSIRALAWLRMKEKKLSPRQIELQLKITTYLGPLMTLAFTVWAAALFDYGNEYQQALVGMLVITCMTLTAIILSILPMASTLAVAAACIPFAYKFLSSGSILLTCMLLASVAIAALLQQVLRRYSSTFVDLIESQHALHEQNREISITKRALIKLAYNDELLDLPNRQKFNRKLEGIIADTPAKPVYIGMIDIDGFKTINDVYGYEIGDKVLRQVAERLKTAISGKGIVARYDGDEFSFILTSATDEDGAVQFASRLRDELEAPYSIDEQTVMLTASCGLSGYPRNGRDIETLTSRALYALNHAKTESSDTVTFFAQLHESEIQQHSKIEQALRLAITKNDLFMVYQPIICLETGQIMSCEALARWQDEELGMIPPDQFIQIAEQCGVISELTYLLLKKAVKAACEWPGDVTLSFNMSAQDIISPTAGLRILSILSEAGLDPRRLEVELTETAFLADFEAANATIRGLRASGISVVLDDFGTGHSGLKYVEKIELDKLKIDRAFVCTVESSAKTRHIVRAIADMCNNLKIRTVAEGVENEDQAQIMRDLGCSLGQGYLFSRPMPNAALKKLFNKQRAISIKQTG